MTSFSFVSCSEISPDLVADIFLVVSSMTALDWSFDSMLSLPTFKKILDQKCLPQQNLTQRKQQHGISIVNVASVWNDNKRRINLNVQHQLLVILNSRFNSL